MSDEITPVKVRKDNYLSKCVKLCREAEEKAQEAAEAELPSEMFWGALDAYKLLSRAESILAPHENKRNFDVAQRDLDRTDEKVKNTLEKGVQALDLFDQEAFERAL